MQRARTWTPFFPVLCSESITAVPINQDDWQTRALTQAVFPTYRRLDFPSIHSVMHWCAVDDQQDEAQEKGAAAHKLKEVQASTQRALGHDLFTDKGQQRQQLKKETN